ncbi:MAG: AhpC/TSA family protein [Bacteroidetes bacterium]|nr:AhpC/TSA family protein [Bacteroidota bacterium]
MLRKSLIPVLIISSILSCNRKETAVISGVVENPKEKNIQISRVEIGSVVAVDTVKFRAGGKFRFRIEAPQTEYYQVGYSGSDFVTLLIHPGDKITLDFTGDRLTENFSVEGSPESVMIRDLENKLEETRRRLNSLVTTYDSFASKPAMKAMADSVDRLITETVTEQRNHSINFILSNLNSMVSILALYQRFNDNTYVLYTDRDLQLMKLVTDSLSVRYPSSLQVKALSEDFNRELNRFQNRQLQLVAESMEPVELDPNLLTPAGKRVSLSSLKGKHVLLTFWSTGSADCIQNNVQLKELYSQYRNRGFEIYQINIDTDTLRWKNAISFDELPWISVREDDPAKLKYAYFYNVQALPANYLYNPGGDIVATNIFGRTLAIKLEQIFGR